MDKLQMDKRMEDILDNMQNNSLELDDAFAFKCRGCGKCCKNREDILLTTRDLYNIAVSLGRTIEYVVERYCEVYIGRDSRMPIIRLMPTGPERVCPLMRGKKCIVHAAKPSVCALFPLGRAVSFDRADKKEIKAEDIRPVYFSQPAVCGTQDKSQTVREWLTQFGIPIEDEFYGLWNENLAFLSDFFRELEKNNVTEKSMEIIRNAAVRHLYISYDPKMALIPQFRENTTHMKKYFRTIKEQLDIFLGGAADGR